MNRTESSWHTARVDIDTVTEFYNKHVLNVLSKVFFPESNLILIYLFSIAFSI